MENGNGTFWLHMFRNYIKIAWSTNSWLPDFNFYLLILVPYFSVTKFFSLVLTQVNKVFLSTLYLAATSFLLSPFSRSVSAWHFSRSVLWVCFSFPATNILRTNNTTTWRKCKQKNTWQYLASFEALNHSNISTFDSGIRKLEHFSIWIQCIWTLAPTHIMKTL